MLGKRKLYEWISKQDGVTDVVLEGWLPETHQRPDIMFRYNNRLYVIEYQCTPIATEYLERKMLYDRAGIKNIWVLGTRQYLKYSSGSSNLRVRSIEEPLHLYFDPFLDLVLSPRKEKYHGFINSFENDTLNETISCIEKWGVGTFTDKRELVCTKLDWLMFSGHFVVNMQTNRKYSRTVSRLSEIRNSIMDAFERNLNGIIDEPIIWNFGKCSDESFSTTWEGETMLHESIQSNVGKNLAFDVWQWFSNRTPVWEMRFYVGRRESIVSQKTTDDFIAFLNKTLRHRVLWLAENGNKPSPIKENSRYMKNQTPTTKHKRKR
jgi:hypothetical protein